ncbi:unnamed protein product [Linum tenue]|uniref:Protease Do-like PDZ domain-containing protein n=1 Tax=Linum tenue TaxID=586396 RepID=A0AAV0NBG9_9ROSI|nr:unnamed protein product [Linum tenue]
MSPVSERRLTRQQQAAEQNGHVNRSVGPGTEWETVVRVVPAMDAVVKVFCVHTDPNFSLPWQRKRQYSSSCSGFIIGGRRVLTNAHSVEHHTQVKLKKRGSDTKYLATVWPLEPNVILFPMVSAEVCFSFTSTYLDLRVAMGMASDQKGVRVRRIEPTAPESEVLKLSDILLSFDVVKIANDGTIPFRDGERIGFSYLVSQKYTGDKALVKVLRGSKVLEFKIKLQPHKRLIPAHINGKLPSYYIVAGFVFSAVSVPYLRSEVLVADINIRYEDIVNTQVITFNGKPVKNLKCLANMVESCKDEYLKFELEYQQVVMVVKTETAKAATLDILAMHCIPSTMSDDLKP